MTTRPSQTSSRKAQHLAINLNEDVAAKGVASGFSSYGFVHCALPEIDLAEVDTTTRWLGRSLRAPMLISCMTGGVPEAARVNEILAQAAQHCGVALGLGSARILLESPDAPGFFVRRLAPSVPLLANLGAVQLNKGVGLDQCRRLVELVEADALVLHLNPLQEALQAEGDTCFRGLVTRIERIARGLDVAVIVKEVGWGIDAGLARVLVDAGVSAIDVAGAGGTSWSEVERHRLEGRQARVAGAFASWGIPTTDALLAARRAVPDTVLIASGGIRQGMDVAVAVALGADLVGAAGPMLHAAAAGVDTVVDVIEEWRDVLRITMFCVGAADLAHLRRTPRLTRDGAVIARPTRRLRRQIGSVLEPPVARSPRVVGRA